MPASFTFFKGRVALYAILKALGLRAGDEVILPGFTCVAVPNAVLYLGATPVYVDIDERTYNIDPLKIDEKITRRTKAIIAQHTFGVPAEMDTILAIAREHNLYVIEDSCHAIGSRYKGEKVGFLGDAAFFSSQWSKPVTTGLGGWAVVNNPVIEESMLRVLSEFKSPSLKESLLLRIQYLTYSRLLRRSFFWLARDAYRLLSKFGIIVGSSTPEELESKMPDGYMKKMSPWQVSVLEKKLRNVGIDIEHNKRIETVYRDHLEGKGIGICKTPAEVEPVYLRFPVLVKDKEKVLYLSRKARMEIGDWFLSPVHPNLDGWERASYRRGMCPISERVSESIINLPTHRKVRVDEAVRIADFMSRFIMTAAC